MSKGGKAVRIVGSGGPETLQIGDLDIRDPGPGQVRVAVAAAGLNRADVLQRRGFYPAPAGVPADIPGLEYAGTVAALGEGVDGWSVGDRVMGIVAGGGMATDLIVHERELIAAPRGMELTHAAAIPEVFMTAYDALFVRGAARLGQWVLVHAGASGVGTAALQLAAAAGLRAIATSRTKSKLDELAQRGVEHRVLVEDGQFADAVASITNGHGADVILDFIGAAYLGQNLKAAAGLGKIVVIGLMGGVKGEIPLGLLLSKRLTMIGTVLRSRALEEKADLAQRFAREVIPLFEAGRLEPVIDSVMPMSEVAAAHIRMESNETFGKIVLSWE